VKTSSSVLQYIKVNNFLTVFWFSMCISGWSIVRNKNKNLPIFTLHIINLLHPESTFLYFLYHIFNLCINTYEIKSERRMKGFWQDLLTIAKCTGLWEIDHIEINYLISENATTSLIEEVWFYETSLKKSKLLYFTLFGKIGVLWRLNGVFACNFPSQSTFFSYFL